MHFYEANHTQQITETKLQTTNCSKRSIYTFWVKHISLTDKINTPGRQTISTDQLDLPGSWISQKNKKDARTKRTSQMKVLDRLARRTSHMDQHLTILSKINTLIIISFCSMSLLPSSIKDLFLLVSVTYCTTLLPPLQTRDRGYSGKVEPKIQFLVCLVNGPQIFKSNQ